MSDPAYLVVGGGNGLGAETARELARERANVVVSDLGTAVDGMGSDPVPAHEVAEEIKGHIDGASAVAHFGDAADADDVTETVETVFESFGRLDGVANFAGILRGGMSWTLSDEDWDAVVRTHLRSNFTLLRVAVRHWRETDDPPEDRSVLAVSSRIVEYASIGATIEVGDVITTGTSEGVSAIEGGDTIDAEIEDVGQMTVEVTERDVAFEDVDVEKSQKDE